MTTYIFKVLIVPDGIETISESEIKPFKRRVNCT